MSDQTPTTPVKKWYQSKIVLLGLTMTLITVTNLVTGFLTGQGVTPEQLESIQTVYPQIGESVAKLQAGESIFNVLGGIFGALVVVLRVWFTEAKVML